MSSSQCTTHSTHDCNSDTALMLHVQQLAPSFDDDDENDDDCDNDDAVSVHKLSLSR